MGVSIDIHVYDRAKLVADIDKYVKQEGGYREGAIPADDFLTAVGNEFGRLTPTEFLVLWNEYYEEYNSGSNFLNAVDRYYFPERDEDSVPPDSYKDGKGYYDTFWSDGYGYIHGNTCEEVLSGVFPDEFGEEGNFTDE